MYFRRLLHWSFLHEATRSLVEQNNNGLYEQSSNILKTLGFLMFCLAWDSGWSRGGAFAISYCPPIFSTFHCRGPMLGSLRKISQSIPQCRLPNYFVVFLCVFSIPRFPGGWSLQDQCIVCRGHITLASSSSRLSGGRVSLRSFGWSYELPCL